ncbi:MAG TPA: beta-L-arabinofuranosidase domain-containing protein [Terracidiphilus sp.]|nr:beta-L-arabinofuranosidase domain-containing protein [Terracidiphilus sp.]
MHELNPITRREFLSGACAVALGTRFSSGRARGSSGFLTEFDYGEVRLTGGLLKEQYDRILASYLALDNDRLLKVYRQQAGLPAPGADMGGWYDAGGFVPGHSLGQYISGLARMGRSTGHSGCREKVRELVEGFAATMGRDDRIFAGPNAEKVWPCYVLDKHLAGLIDAATLSGVELARELLPRVYRGALPYIPGQGHDRAGKKNPPYDETYVLPENLFTSHELTAEKAFRERAIRYLLDREFFDPLARGEDVLPGRHAYSHAIALSSAGKAHLVLEDDKYLHAMQQASRLLTGTQQYATGGWGPNETFIEPHKGQLYASLHNTEDHFETPCGSYAATKLARYLLCATGDARYGDGLERVIFNALLAAKDPDRDGDYFYYSTYSPRARKVYYPKKWPCCSGTLVQGVADYVKDIYFRSPDGIRVTLYAASEVRWMQERTAVQLTQHTRYPLEDTIAISVKVSEPAAFTIGLRMPGWLSQPACMQVNGRQVHPQDRHGFALIARTWQDGDVIRVDLPQSVMAEPIDDLHPGVVALLRGPLVYVALNPPDGLARMPDMDTWRPIANPMGAFRAGGRGAESILSPLYRVHEERYSTYFQKS